MASIDSIARISSAISTRAGKLHVSGPHGQKELAATVTNFDGPNHYQSARRSQLCFPKSKRKHPFPSSPPPRISTCCSARKTLQPPWRRLIRARTGALHHPIISHKHPAHSHKLTKLSLGLTNVLPTTIYVQRIQSEPVPTNKKSRKQRQKMRWR